MFIVLKICVHCHSLKYDLSGSVPEKKCQKSCGLHMRLLQGHLVLQESLLKDVNLWMTLKVALEILANL